ncbi:MAG: nucleotide exchange factor GrpE [Candidatus Marsarchaeota archaeon]|jgi:molecular chaperone GrpE|nr:nucleotide exchange factor GrpE [Candidatus Marsarchaeota archaeon]
MNGDNKDNKNIKFTAGSEEKKQNVEEKVDEKVKKDELVECKERLLQLAAEFDNYKKRIKNEIDISKQKGKAEFIKELLPIIDEFELALIAAKKSNDENIKKGIELLYSNFVGALKKEGLKEINSDGLYDPYQHEIILIQEDNSKPDGTIIEIAKKGYTFNGILLRVASVIVSKNNNKEIKK